MAANSDALTPLLSPRAKLRLVCEPLVRRGGPADESVASFVRRRLGMYFVPEYECRPGVIRALTLDPRLEQLLNSKVHRSPTDVGLALEDALIPLVPSHLPVSSRPR